MPPLPLKANPDTDNPRCMPTGSVCCSGAGYCPAGNTCTTEGKCQAPGPTCDAGKVVCGTGYSAPSLIYTQTLTVPDVCPPAASAALGLDTALQATPVQPRTNARLLALPVTQARSSAELGTAPPSPSSIPLLTVSDVCPPAASAALALDIALQATPAQPIANARLLALPVTQAR